MLRSILLIGYCTGNDYFNILSIDGGGIRGLIPAMTIKHMEEYAY
jgi:patatin-like phospholipase/acyl hydrolase